MLTAVEITNIKINSHQVPVPVGLSELLSSTWVKERKETDALNGYDRQVINRNGQLITRLSKK